jgi:hypothetical protein
MSFINPEGNGSLNKTPVLIQEDPEEHLKEPLKEILQLEVFQKYPIDRSKEMRL